MARAGVNYHDIVKAAEAIKLQGQEPTVDRVREHLGTGSKSTIGPLLKRWRSDRVDEAEVNGLPSDLIQEVKALHERLQQAADVRIEQVRENFEAAFEKRREELDEANRRITELTARQRDLESQVERLTTDNRQQSQAFEETRIALAKAESQRDESSARASELKDTIVELKQENRDIRSHFEHYQDRVAEDRQLERDQFREAKQLQMGQLDSLNSQLKQAQSKQIALTDANKLLQKEAAKFEKANSELQLSVSQKLDEIQYLKRNQETALENTQKYEDEKKQLTHKAVELSNQRSRLNKEVALLIQALDTTKAELETTKDRLGTLTNEYKIVLQEKAVLQGQFQQVQKTM